MSEHFKYVEPYNWQKHWDKKRLAFLKKLIPAIQYAFAERDYDVCFYLIPREIDAYVSMGCRPEGKKKSFLSAFGFFLNHAMTWPMDYIDHMADRAIEQYERFDRGEWPISQIHDKDVMDRVAKRDEAEEDVLS